MSYRNPPIIVDRSTDIWGKAIANFGKQVAQGILSIGEAKKKAGQAQAAQTAKDAAAMQKLTTATRESYMSDFRDSYIALKKKDGNLAEQFKKQTMIDLNGDGKKLGAIDAQVQLSLNSNLSDFQIKEYNKTVDSAKMYQAQAVDGFGKVISGIDNVKSKSHELLAAPGGWSFKGNNNLERLQNQLAYYAVDVDKMINPDVKESRKMVRGDKGENFLEAITLVPLDQFKEGGTFSRQLTPEQEKGMEKVVEGGKEYYKFSFKRDANEWDGEFIVDIHDLPDYSEVYQEAGIEDKKGTINQKLTGQIEIAEGGYEDREELIDIKAIRENESLNTIMLGKASAIEQGDDESKQAFLTFALGKSGTTIKEFNKQYPTPEGRIKYIKNSLIDDSISKKFEEKYSSRAATPEDVERLKAFNPASGVSEGDEILFSNIGSKKAKVEEIGDPTQFKIKVGQAVKAAPGIFKEMTSPKTAAAYFKDKKIGGEKIIAARINTSTSEVAARGTRAPKILELDFISGSSTAKGERTEFTDTMKFDLNNTTRLKTLIDLLPDSDILKQELRKLIKNPLLK